MTTVMARLYPTQKKFEIIETSGQANVQLRVDRELSKMNRRLYREGRVYTCKLDLNPQQAQPGSFVEIFALKDTWFIHKAWQTAFEEYLNATKQERDRAGKSQSARWNDFRVNSGTGLQLLNARHYGDNGSVASLTDGEFLLSEVEDGSGTTRQFTWSDSPTAGEYGILVEYAKEGGPSDMPTSPTTSQPYASLDSDSSNVEWDDVTDHGNEPPYRDTINDSYPWTKVATLSVDAGMQKLSSGFFNAPCGIVMIRGLSTQVAQELVLEVKAGDYKGVHAPRMFNEIKNMGDDVKVV
jgi:hypothetical protein